MHGSLTVVCTVVSSLSPFKPLQTCSKRHATVLRALDLLLWLRGCGRTAASEPCQQASRQTISAHSAATTPATGDTCHETIVIHVYITTGALMAHLAIPQGSATTLIGQGLQSAEGQCMSTHDAVHKLARPLYWVAAWVFVPAALALPRLADRSWEQCTSTPRGPEYAAWCAAQSAPIECHTG